MLDIKLQTVFSYIAVAAASNPGSVDFARLAQEAKLTYREAAATATGKLQRANCTPCKADIRPVLLCNRLCSAWMSACLHTVFDQLQAPNRDGLLTTRSMHVNGATPHGITLVGRWRAEYTSGCMAGLSRGAEGIPAEIWRRSGRRRSQTFISDRGQPCRWWLPWVWRGLTGLRTAASTRPAPSDCAVR